MKTGRAISRGIAALQQSLMYITVDNNPELFAETHFNMGVAYLMQTDIRDRWANARRGLASLSCSLMVLDKLNLLRAKTPATYLKETKTVMGDARFVDELQRRPQLDGCSFNVEDTIAVVKKYGG